MPTRGKKKKPVSRKKSAAKPKAGSTGIMPLADRILLKPLSEQELGTVSPGGIIIPETVDKEKPEQGRVVAVGPGKYEDGELRPLSVKVGDRVVFSKYGYDEVKIGGEEYYIISESNILAILK